MIIFVFNLSLCFISRFGRFHEDFPLKEGTVRVPLPFSRNRPKKHSHNLGEALGKGLGLLCAPFTLSIPFTSLSLSPLYPFHHSIPFTSLSLSPLYPFHLSIPFTSLSLSPLYPFHPSLSLSLSYTSLSIYISLLLPFFLSLFSLSFSLAYLMDVFVLVIYNILTSSVGEPEPGAESRDFLQ